jgi:ABC-type Na+ transport system ATPase subunit NatA
MNTKDIDINKIDDYIKIAKQRIEEQKAKLTPEELKKVDEIVNGVDITSVQSMESFLKKNK